MARTNLPTTALAANAGTLVPAGTTIDQANGMNVTLASSAIPAGSGPRHLLLSVANTAGVAKNVIIRAGASNPPAFRKDIGDLTVSVTNATTQLIGPLEGARFLQSDGSINVDFGSGITGTIIAYLVPNRW